MKLQEAKIIEISNKNNCIHPTKFNNFYNVDMLLNEEKIESERNKLINKSEEFGEEINMIQTLWEDLGVTHTYRLIFESITLDLDDSMKKDLLDFEINSLKKFSECLMVMITINI